MGKFPGGAERNALADDLTLLDDMLGELLAASIIGLRLEVVRHAMCPRLHVVHCSPALPVGQGPRVPVVLDAGWN